MTTKIKKIDKSFYYGILTALNLLALHGEDTIFVELVDMCDVKELVAVAVENGELEWSGLSKHGYSEAAK